MIYRILKNRSNLAQSDVSPESTVEIACFVQNISDKNDSWGVRGFPPKKILKNRSNLAPSDVSPNPTVEIACLCSEYLPTKMTDCSDMDPNRRQIFLTAARPCPTRPPYPYPVSLKTPRQMADLIISNRFQFYDFFYEKSLGLVRLCF